MFSSKQNLIISHLSSDFNFFIVGLLTACGLGIMRTMYASYKAELNCVAVDVVAKTLIVAAWKAAMDNGHCATMNNGPELKQQQLTAANEVNENLNCRQFRVYNCASLHNMDLQLLVYDGQYSIRKLPFEKCIYLPGGGVTLCKFMNALRVSARCWFTHTENKKKILVYFQFIYRYGAFNSHPLQSLIKF